MSSVGIDPIRLKIADILEGIANTPGWPEDFWKQFHQLIGTAEVDGLLTHADEELIHYSGLYDRRSHLLIYAKSDQGQAEAYKEEFLNIAAALRNGSTWTEYKRQNGISEGVEAFNAVLGRLRKLFRR